MDTHVSDHQRAANPCHQPQFRNPCNRYISTSRRLTIRTIHTEVMTEWSQECLHSCKPPQPPLVSLDLQALSRQAKCWTWSCQHTTSITNKVMSTIKSRLQRYRRLTGSCETKAICLRYSATLSSLIGSSSSYPKTASAIKICCRHINKKNDLRRPFHEEDHRTAQSIESCAPKSASEPRGKTGEKKEKKKKRIK